MKYTLQNYDLQFDHIKIFCDNMSTIHMKKNTNQYSKTKYIEIKYYFLRNHFEKGNIVIDYVPTDKQFVNTLTKSLNFNRFSFIYGELNLCILSN